MNSSSSLLEQVTEAPVAVAEHEAPEHQLAAVATDVSAQIADIFSVTEVGSNPQVRILRKGDEFTVPVHFEGMLTVLSGKLEILYPAAEEKFASGDFDGELARDYCWEGEYVLDTTGIKTSNGEAVRLRALEGDVCFILR